jgi:hypothetical protein
MPRFQLNFAARWRPSACFAEGMIHHGITRNPFSPAPAAPRIPSQAPPSPSSSASAPATQAPSFLANFTGALGPAQPAGTTPQPAATAPQPAQPGSPGYIPSLESVFGTENCWEAAPTGIGPNGTYSYNPIYFATQQTAQVVAKMLGGTVVQVNAIANGGGFQQQEPNYMVQMPDGRQFNAGLVANLYDHGYSQGFINQEIAGMLNGL